MTEHFVCVVYNMSLLVDFLTQERIRVIETRKKPRITFRRFLKMAGQKVGRIDIESGPCLLFERCSDKD